MNEQNEIDDEQVVSTGFTFVDEIPQSDRGAVGREPKYMDVAAVLREHPGKIIMLDEKVNTSFASAVNKGKLKAFRPEGHYVATTRNADEDGKVDVYIRYVGEPEMPADSPDDWGY